MTFPVIQSAHRHCWLGDRKDIWTQKNLTSAVTKGFSVEDPEGTWPNLR